VITLRNVFGSYHAVITLQDGAEVRVTARDGTRAAAVDALRREAANARTHAAVQIRRAEAIERELAAPMSIAGAQ
jgi:hypothetical protein